MRYQRGEVRLKPDYIKAVQALPGRLEAGIPRGPEAWTVRAWRELSAEDRMSYHYEIIPTRVLIDMRQRAQAEVNSQHGTHAQDLARERTGFNAIVKIIGERGEK